MFVLATALNRWGTRQREEEGAADESHLERGKTWGELPSPSSTMGARNLMRLKTGMTLKD